MKRTIIFLFIFLGAVTGSVAVARAATASVIINEVAWMGTIDSANDEWIELYNPGSEAIDLTGWRLAATDGSPAINLTGAIPAAGYFLLERTSDETVPGAAADQIYTGALGNGGEVLELADAAGNLIDRIDAAAGWPAGDNEQKLTMERRAASSWQSSAEAGGTPKTENSAGAAPVVPETETPSSSLSTPPPAEEDQGASSEPADIIISEILPDPVGADLPNLPAGRQAGQAGDKGEFIELENKGEQPVYLSGWRLETKNLKFEIQSEAKLVIEPKRFLVLWRSDTRLPLSNQDDTVKLFAPGKSRAAASVRYKKPPTGKSYSRDGAGLSAGEAGDWFWSGRPTPGAKNHINHPPVVEFSFDAPVVVGRPTNFDSSDSFDPDGETLAFTWDFGDGIANRLANPEHTFLKAGSFKVRLSVADADNSVTSETTVKVIDANATSTAAKTKTKVKSKASPSVKGVKVSSVVSKAAKSWARLRGVALVKPGILGAQIFYIGGENNLQVYNYKKDFPPIKPGDYLEVSGELGEVDGEPRLKTKNAAAIKLLGEQAEPTAKELACADLAEEHLGRLVKLTGEVTKKMSATVYLDDNTEEALVYLKVASGLTGKDFSLGEKVSVTGILSKTASGFRLLPRGITDIARINTASAAVLGESAASDVWALPARDKKTEMLEYFLIVAGGIIVVLAGLMTKYRKRITRNVNY